MKTATIILLIIIGLVIFVIGGGAGVFYQTQKDAPQFEKFIKMESTIKILSSKVIPSIIAYGKIENINGRELTLSYEGESIVVRVIENVLINIFSVDGDGNRTQQSIDFSQIKQGDNVHIEAKLSQEGVLEGQELIIFKNLDIQ